MLSVEAQAEQLKQKGNEYFKRDKLCAAIDAYTEAIALCPTKAAFWTNRALCHKRRGRWGEVRDDCERALAIDKSNFKAHRLLGQASCQLGDFPVAIRALSKALELGLQHWWGPEDPNILELERDLLRAKHQEWQSESAERRRQRESLNKQLALLLHEDHERRLLAPRTERDVKSKPKVPHLFRWLAPRQTTAKGAAEWPRQRSQECPLKEEHVEALATLEGVFRAAGSADTPSELPDFLCCKITLELFRDPVIAPSGVTYERSVILAHLQKGKRFDPLTRAPLREADLVPNIAMREAVSDFVQKHGWAHQSVFHPSSMPL